MSSLEEESGTSVRSKTRSAPQSRANVRSKRSSATTTGVQLPETKEADSQVVALNPKTHAENLIGQWIKFVVWIAAMGVLLEYGMHQHDDYILFVVMILVTVGCGFGSAVEVLIKFLDTRGLKLLHPPKTE